MYFFEKGHKRFKNICVPRTSIFPGKVLIVEIVELDDLPFLTAEAVP